jgi:hypothetical protein
LTNTYTINVAAEGGTDVSSRRLARELRKRALVAIVKGRRVEFDFAGVECASDSFLDELIAVPVAQHGKRWLRDNVSLTNLSGLIRRDLLAAVAARLNDTGAQAIFVRPEATQSL